MLQWCQPVCCNDYLLIMNLFDKAASLFVASTFAFFTPLASNSQGYFDASTGIFKCTNGMPEFTGSRPSGYTNAQAREACGCIKTRFTKTGWEIEVYEKAMKGDTSDWRYRGIMGRLRNAVRSCTADQGL